MRPFSRRVGVYAVIGWRIVVVEQGNARPNSAGRAGFLVAVTNCEQRIFTQVGFDYTVERTIIVVVAIQIGIGILLRYDRSRPHRPRRV